MSQPPAPSIESRHPDVFDASGAVQNPNDQWVRDHVWYPISRWYLRPLAKVLSVRLAQWAVSPNLVTVFGFALAAFATVALSAANWAPPHWNVLPLSTLLPALLLLAYWVADQVDGHLARLTHRCSPYGAWLDANLDELIDLALHVTIGWVLYVRHAHPAALLAAILFLAGKYLFIYGLSGRQATDQTARRSTDPPASWPTLRRLYHLPADADVRLHLLVGAILLDPWLGTLWLELAFVAAYYNFRWLVRHVLIYRRRNRLATDTVNSAIPTSSPQVLGPIRVKKDRRPHRLPVAELAPLCQKPGYRVRGTWMARRIARPLALYVTRWLLPLGIGANAVTAAAALCGILAAVALALGPRWGLAAGALLLQLWYLLDHVDGQVARFRGTASVSGTYADYLMHYVVHACCPFGIGWGLFRVSDEPHWILAGACWSLGMVLLGLVNDCRYKAFFRRLQHTPGLQRVQGMADGGPQPPPPMPPVSRPIRLCTYVAQKACEMHVITNGLTAIAAVGIVWPLPSRWMLSAVLLGMAIVTPATALWRASRSVASAAPEREFAAWFPAIDPREHAETGPTSDARAAAAVEHDVNVPARGMCGGVSAN